MLFRYYYKINKLYLYNTIPAVKTAKVRVIELAEVDLSFEISDRIEVLMRQRGLSKKQFADALGRRPSEITKWLSGQHNFTIATIAMLSSFFGQPIITVS